MKGDLCFEASLHFHLIPPTPPPRPQQHSLSPTRNLSLLIALRLMKGCLWVCSFRVCHLPVNKCDGSLNYWQYSLVLWVISGTQSYFCRVHHILYYMSATLFLTTAIHRQLFLQRTASSGWLHWACRSLQAHSLTRQSTAQMCHVLDDSSPRRYARLKD